MIKYFFIYILFMSNYAFAVEPIKIEFENNDNNLRLYLINVSHDTVTVNKRLTFGYEDSLIPPEVEFEILDKEGNKIPLAVIFNEGVVTEKDLILLHPRDIVGREYRAKLLVPAYFLGPGIYKVKATYKNVYFLDKGVYGGRLTTDWITFEVTEAEVKNAFGENWRKIRQDALERRKKILIEPNIK